MVHYTFLILLLTTIASTFAFPHPDQSDVITQPKPGEEYVFVQTSSSGARPIARKDKHVNEERPFETSHKLPPSLTYILNDAESEDKTENKKARKREADPGNAPAPAPAGAIKLNVQKLLEKYKTELKTSTTAKPKTTTTTTKSSRRRGNKRTKKEIREEVQVTSPSPVLTTGASAPKPIDDDSIPLVASGSEKQRSRIQIKKAPNGQEYEYEYVYYYYDEDDDPKAANAVPARTQNSNKTPNRARGEVEKTSAAPEVNEVLPSSKSRTRGRQFVEEEVGEERLPANTRFPPRSRNLNTTPLPEEETKVTRGRTRGRPTTELATNTGTEIDSVSDETQGSRGRTRANVRRPSLDLVDNASFNTHTNTAGAEPSSGSPSFPTDLPAGPVRFLGATPNESVDPPEPIRKPELVEAKKDDSVTDRPAEEHGTTGTQKLSGEDAELSTEENATEELTTVEATTEAVVETTTPTTTTTTTTTTRTTTTTTTEAPLGRGRYKGRGRKTTHSASTTEASHAETKPKSKFSRPSFGGRPRPGARTTTEASAEHDSSKEESKASHSRPTLSRNRFGSSRTRARTTAAPSDSHDEASGSTSAPVSRPSLTRPRSSFNLRARGRTTAAPTENESPADAEASSSTEGSTTARNRRIQSGSGVRPLRPGPRINLGRGRPGQSTTTTEKAAAEDHVTGDEHQASSSNSNAESSDEKESEAAAAPVDNSPLGRLRNKHRVNVQARPKAAASAPVQVRRVNPLLAKRRPGQTTEASSSEATQESVSTEAAAEAAEANEETEASSVASSTTTEEPRGLSKLLAGRRRLAARQGAHH